MWTYFAAFLAGVAISGAAVWRTQEWRHDSIDKQRIEAANETARLRAKGADTAAAGHEGFKEKERVVYQTITKTVDRLVERPLYSNICLDADGLRELNAAVNGRDPDTGQPTPAVP